MLIYIRIISYDFSNRYSDADFYVYFKNMSQNRGNIYLILHNSTVLENHLNFATIFFSKHKSCITTFMPFYAIRNMGLFNICTYI